MVSSTFKINVGYFAECYEEFYHRQYVTKKSMSAKLLGSVFEFQVSLEKISRPRQPTK